MKKLTFKEYLESKAKLKEAVSTSSKCTSTYTVKKYCRLIVGESKDMKENIPLKPSQQLIIEWKYENISVTPNPVSVIIRESTGAEEEFKTYWSGEKLMGWLQKNTLQSFE